MDAMRSDNSFIESFYSNDNKFNNFQDISCEDIELLEKKAQEIKAYLEQRYRVYARMYGVYIDTIKYLTFLESNGEITCDEKMFLFIILMDPKLEIYDVYIKNPSYSKEEIDKELDSIVQNNMYQSNYRSQRNIDRTLKNVLGYCDEKLIKYETLYKRNVVCRNKINLDVRQDLTNEILKIADEIPNLDDITEKRFQDLVAISNRLREDIKALSLPVLTNAILYQTNLLGVRLSTEKVLLFLLVLDCNFHLIDIYEEESNYHQIKARALEELGFYRKNLINIEKMMIKKFYPNKREANWMLLKSTD